MATPVGAYRSLLPVASCRHAIARPLPARRSSHFFACDRLWMPRTRTDKTPRWTRSQSRHRPAIRQFSVTAAARHGHLDPPKPGQEYGSPPPPSMLYTHIHEQSTDTSCLHRRKVTFIDKDGDSHTFTVSDGDNLLDIAQANDLEMEGTHTSPSPPLPFPQSTHLLTHHCNQVPAAAPAPARRAT